MNSLVLFAHGHSKNPSTTPKMPARSWRIAAIPLDFAAGSLGARQMDDLSRRIREVSTEVGMAGLARGLVRRVDQLGRRVNGHFEIDLTQETLAQMNAVN